MIYYAHSKESGTFTRIKNKIRTTKFDYHFSIPVQLLDYKKCNLSIKFI